MRQTTMKPPSLQSSAHAVAARREETVSTSAHAVAARREETVSTSWISKEPDRCGGDACIRNSRIPVWVLVNYCRLGGSDADLFRDYPSLTPADLEAAREYARMNAEEIDRAIQENEEGEAGIEE